MAGLFTFLNFLLPFKPPELICLIGHILNCRFYMFYQFLVQCFRTAAGFYFYGQMDAYNLSNTMSQLFVKERLCNYV